jgi:uncharacterized membrane protein
MDRWIVSLYDLVKDVIPKELFTILVAALPISELRGAIPLSILSFNFSVPKAFSLALLGNILPVVPFMLFLRHLSDKLMKSSKLANKFFNWWFARVRGRSKNIEKYKFIGLAIFVAIPLPMTGAWSGCVAAYLLGIRLFDAIFSILLGVIVAGIVVTCATVGIGNILKFL